LKYILCIALFSFSFIGCINDGSLKPVIPNNIINANSAKTWVKTVHIENGVNKTPLMKELRTTFTLYENGTFREQKYAHIGSNLGKKGSYSLAIPTLTDTVFTFFYSNSEPISFEVKYIDLEEIRLTNDSMSWTLETLKPPKLK